MPESEEELYCQASCLVERTNRIAHHQEQSGSDDDGISSEAGSEAAETDNLSPATRVVCESDTARAAAAQSTHQQETETVINSGADALERPDIET